MDSDNTSPPSAIYKLEEDGKEHTIVNATAHDGSFAADPSQYEPIRQRKQEQEITTGYSSPILPASNDPVLTPAPYPPFEEPNAADAIRQLLATRNPPNTTDNVSYSSRDPETPCPPSREPPGGPCQSGPSRPSTRLPSIAELGLSTFTPKISELALNKIASIALGVTRRIAGLGDEEAARMWKLWLIRLQPGTTSKVQPPAPGATQQQRQQAVVWLGQDVYRGLLSVDRGWFSDRLRICEIFIEVAKQLDDDEAVSEIRALFRQEVGHVSAGSLAG
ncbi:MAG: hypothetical protein L6R39_000470 [Caloplaca ligustica]|nr:MAG: hypothetical protein L6R39_000470 [Caloplaca ligustica]